jgi:hypothetical protein
MARSCLDEAESLFLSNLSMLPSTNQSVPGWSQLHLQGWLADEAALIHMQHASHRSYLVEFLTGIAPLGVNDSFVPTSVCSLFSICFWFCVFVSCFHKSALNILYFPIV